MTTLTDFLLARITEDESTAPRVHCETCMYLDAGGDLEPCDCGQPTRVLAECEAKRRIVELHSGGAEWCGWTQGGDGTHDDMGNGPADCDTARALAQAYADHPDYDESWAISE